MSKVIFKAKVKERLYADGEVDGQYIAVPKITGSHYDKREFFSHPKLGVVANSDLMQAAVNKMVRAKFSLGCSNEFRVDQFVEGVTVDTSGFLATVTVAL